MSASLKIGKIGMRGFVGRCLGLVWLKWCEFWFESNQPRVLRLFRLSFGILALTYYAIRTFDLELFFSSHGVMPFEAVNDVMPMDFRWSIFFLFKSTAALWVAHVVSLVAIALMTIGVYPRLAAFVAYVLHVSFMHRDMAPSYGVDLISTFFFLYLAFVNTKKEKSIASSIAYRLLQMQVCIIYAYAGLDKVRGLQWWGGEALWGVFANAQLARFDFSFVSNFPLFIVALTYSTLAWEVYFPALIWVRGVKWFMIAFGVALHLGIGLVVNIPYFGFLMIVSYLLFFDNDVVKSIESRIPLIARVG